MSNRGLVAITAGGSIWIFTLLAIVLADVPGRAQTQPPQPPYSQDEDYGYGKAYLTDAQRAGRDTWYFWTGGNEKFWVKMAEITEGNVNLLDVRGLAAPRPAFRDARRRDAARVSRRHQARSVRALDG